MSAVLRVMEELVEHLNIVRVLSCKNMAWVLMKSFHCLLPDWVFVVLRDFVENFLKFVLIPNTYFLFER